MQGTFITLEGIDGCGKTTQLEQLDRYLQARGIRAIITCEPGGTEIGRKIRDLLLDIRHQQMQAATEMLLYAADRAQHVREKLRPALARGEVILCDRYADSTRAYQGVARGLDPALIEQLISIATEGLRPDLTLLFDLPVEAAAARRHARVNGGAGVADDRLDAERREFHERVRQGFLDLAASEPARFVVIDAALSVDGAWEQVRVVVDELFRW